MALILAVQRQQKVVGSSGHGTCRMFGVEGAEHVEFCLQPEEEGSLHAAQQPTNGYDRPLPRAHSAATAIIKGGTHVHPQFLGNGYSNCRMEYPSHATESTFNIDGLVGARWTRFRGQVSDNTLPSGLRFVFRTRGERARNSYSPSRFNRRMVMEVLFSYGTSQRRRALAG